MAMLLVAALLAIPAQAPAQGSAASLYDPVPEPVEWPEWHVVPALGDTITATAMARTGAPPEFLLRVESGPRWGSAMLDLTAANVGIWAWNRYVLGAEWAVVSPKSWMRNLDHGMEWDTDPWKDNQILHPIHGSLYFMAGRANGFGFWGSIPVTATGSLLWEYFAESKRPSLNDVAMTTGGGVVLGEVGYRLASLIIDESATGFDRIGRELLALLASPGLALHRTMRGSLMRAAEPPPPRATLHDITLGTGVAREQASSLSGSVSGIVRARLLVGDRMAPGPARPFDYFEGSFEVGTGTGVGEVTARGVLGRLSESIGAGGGRVLSGTMGFEMLNIQSLQYSAPGAGLSLWGTRRLGGEWSLETEVQASGLPLVAITSELATPAGRPYDLAAGAEARLSARVRRGVLSLEAHAGAGRFWPLDATSTGQALHRVSVEARVPVARGWAAVVRGRAFERRSTHPGAPSVRVRTTQVDLVLASVIRPRQLPLPEVRSPDHPHDGPPR